jgi:hypothetical protein
MPIAAMRSSRSMRRPRENSAVDRLPSARGHGEASLQLSGVAGAGPAARTERPRSPPRPVFPLARIDGGGRYRRSIGRSPGGYATQRSSGG